MEFRKNYALIMRRGTGCYYAEQDRRRDVLEGLDARNGRWRFLASYLHVISRSRVFADVLYWQRNFTIIYVPADIRLLP